MENQLYLMAKVQMKIGKGKSFSWLKCRGKLKSILWPSAEEKNEVEKKIKMLKAVLEQSAPGVSDGKFSLYIRQV